MRVVCTYHVLLYQRVTRNFTGMLKHIEQLHVHIAVRTLFWYGGAITLHNSRVQQCPEFTMSRAVNDSIRFVPVSLKITC